jgi:hypothetical protein
MTAAGTIEAEVHEAKSRGKLMASESLTVTVPNVTLTLEQLLAAIRQLDEPARKEVAQVLLETDSDAKLASLIARLAGREPADDVSDDEINAEIYAIRQ